MLRLPAFALEHPTTVAGTVALLAAHRGRCKLLAGGTDLLPNLKHRLFEPEVVIALSRVAELKGIRQRPDGALEIGALATLAEVESSDLVLRHAPGLAQAAAAVAGPSQRSMGTLGGNVCLDTRCVWYNQTHFWRKSLGFCLKKDGTACHVVEGGTRCVAAASNDTATMLVALDALLELAGPAGRATVRIRDFYQPDGTYNLRLAPDQLLVRVVVPRPPPGHASGYAKLRPRASIDFPKLSVAATLTAEADGTMRDATLVVSAIAATPRTIAGVADLARGRSVGDPAFLQAAGELARQRIHPLTNLDGDVEYRRAMVPVFVKRAFLAARPSLGCGLGG